MQADYLADLSGLLEECGNVTDAVSAVTGLKLGKRSLKYKVVATLLNLSKKSI
jgi:formylmethanofuran dehydrogenase subunit E